MFDWFKKRKATAKVRLHDRGYDYAAGELLRKGDCIMEELLCRADCPFDKNEFDYGIEKACRDFRDLQQSMF